MPGTARRSLVLAAVVIGVLIFVVGGASGGSPLGSVTSQLHSPASLGGAPHVQVPSVPHVQVPSVPHVSTPSVPSAPSVPHVVTPPSLPSAGSATSTARGVVAGAAGGSSGKAAGATASASGSRNGGTAGGSSGSAAGRGARVHAASAAERRHANAAHERSLRRDVARFAGCLDALPDMEGRLLALRAGLDRPPASRAEAARELGISTRRAAALERRGLRQLRQAGRSGACGSGAGEARQGAALVARSGSVPPLQPAVLLTPRPALTSPAKLSHRHRSRGAAGGSAGAAAGGAPGPGRSSGGRPPGVVHGVETSSTTARWVVGAAILALLVAAFLVAWRRRERMAPPRWAEQTGSAQVWAPPLMEEPPAGPLDPEPPGPDVGGFAGFEAPGSEAAGGPGAAEAGAGVAGAWGAEQAGSDIGSEWRTEEAGSEAGVAPPGENAGADAAAAPPADEPRPDPVAPPADDAPPIAGHRPRRRPRTVALASLASLAVALLTRRRRR